MLYVFDVLDTFLHPTALKPREFINSQVAAKEGSGHISQAAVPIPRLWDVGRAVFVLPHIVWLWSKGNFFKLRGCSCFSPDSLCYLINLIKAVAGSVSCYAAVMLICVSWCPALVLKSQSHVTEVTGFSPKFKERGMRPKALQKKQRFHLAPSANQSSLNNTHPARDFSGHIFGRICLCMQLLDRLQDTSQADFFEDVSATPHPKPVKESKWKLKYQYRLTRDGHDRLWSLPTQTILQFCVSTAWEFELSSITTWMMEDFMCMLQWGTNWKTVNERVVVICKRYRHHCHHPRLLSFQGQII